MKETPPAIRREIEIDARRRSACSTPGPAHGRSRAATSSARKGIPTRRPPKRVQSTCRSGPASFDETVGRGGGHLVAGRGQVRKSADRLAEQLGAMA